MSSRANIRRPRNAGHSRYATVGSTRRHKTKPSWSGTTRRNSIIGVTGGIGSGRVPLSKLNSITMSSKTRKDDDRNKHHHSEDDTMALMKLSFSLQAQHVPLDNSPPLQPPLPFTPVFNASMLQPPPPVQPPPNSAQRRKPKGFLDLSKFEYQPTTNSMNTTNTTNTITTTNTNKTITSPSASQSVSSSAPASPNSRKPPPPPGPPPPSAKRKTTTRPTCEPLLFSSKSKNVHQQYNDERASTITPSTLNVHEEMDAMRQRIADLTYEFKRRDEEQTVAIVVLQKQAKQLERANAHLRRERDRQMGLLQQRKNNHNHNNSSSNNNKHATSTSSTTASTNSSRNSVGSRKSAMQIGLEKQLQLARQQLAKEKKNNASNVKLLAQSQQMLEVQIETLEQHAAAATQRVKQLERLMEQNESDARRWARDQAIAKTEKYQQQIQSLHRQLQEARSQLRASAAASLGQFDTASETTSPQIQYQTESMNSTPPRLDLMMAQTNNNNNNENENENGNEPKNLVPSVVATRTPHPKRLPPPRPS